MEFRKIILSDEFIEKYKDKKPHKQEISEFTYLRTYSNWLEDKKRRERWYETVKRAVEYNFALYQGPATDEELIKEAEEYYDAVFNLQTFPAMRLLWIGGTPASYQPGAFLFNCAFQCLRTFKSFSESLLLLTQGVGMGAKIDKNPNFPRLKRNVTFIFPNYKWNRSYKENTETKLDDGHLTITVGDSRNGWSDALQLFFEALQDSNDVYCIEFNFNNVRPQGERLKSSGGRAAGPEPLRKMFEKIYKTIVEESDDGHLTSLNVLDIFNAIGENVVAGGVRRTAQLVLFDPDDQTIATAKEKYWENPDKLHRRMSNNSKQYWHKPSYEELREVFRLMEQNGEPGLKNAQAARKRRPDYEGGNPCKLQCTFAR